jgi:hypothetical protein
MKVIKAPMTEWSKFATCTSCGAELQIEKSDVKNHYYDGDFRESAYESWSTCCPFCNSKIYISGNEIPKAIQFEIKSGKTLVRK